MGLDHISYMDILALMLSKKFRKALEGLSKTRAAFQGLEDSLSEEKNQEWKWQETQASRHRGMLSRSIRSTKKKVLEFFFGSYDLNDDPLMQCHHRLTSE